MGEVTRQLSAHSDQPEKYISHASLLLSSGGDTRECVDKHLACPNLLNCLISHNINYQQLYPISQILLFQSYNPQFFLVNILSY